MTAASKALDRRYQQALADLRARYGAAVAAQWANLPAYNEADIADLVRAVEALTASVTKTTTQLTSGWLAIRAGTTVSATPATIAATDMTEFLRPAFMTVWGALKDGQPIDQAIAAGGERVGNLGRFYVTTTARAASDYIDQQSPQITAWGREPEAGACSWCQDLSTVVFDSAAAADIGHDNCHCDIVPA